MTGNKFGIDLAAFLYLTVLTLCAIIYAVSVLPSPMTQRDLNFDTQRASDLQQLQTSIDNFYSTKQQLPGSLNALTTDSSLGYYGNLNMKDPLTKQPYEYDILSPVSYKLCANFAMDSADEKKYLSDQSQSSAFGNYTSGVTGFKHGKGKYCTNYSVSDNGYAPAPTFDCVGAGCPVPTAYPVYSLTATPAPMMDQSSGVIPSNSPNKPASNYGTVSQ